MQQDVTKAKRLYRLAASESVGTLWVYTPPVKKGGRGRVLPVSRGSRVEGLIEARKRLEVLHWRKDYVC